MVAAGEKQVRRRRGVDAARHADLADSHRHVVVVGGVQEDHAQTIQLVTSDFIISSDSFIVSHLYRYSQGRF